MNPAAKAYATLTTRLKQAGLSLVGRFPAMGGGGQGIGYMAWSPFRTPWSGWGWGWPGRRRQIDYAAEVGDPGANSAVAACVNWVSTTFPEAPLRVLDPAGEPVPDHPMTALIENPNDFYDGTLLLQCTLADFTVTGNAYWLIAAGAAGRPAQLWYAPSWMLRPRWPADGSAFLDHYDYSPNGVPVRVELDQIVHFRFGLDIRTRLGVSRLAPVLREIFTDEEAAAFTGALLRNMGIPGVILSPKDPDAHMQPEDAEGLKETYKRGFGGDNRGSVMVIEDPVDVSVLSFTPAQMDLKALRRIPEERVSACLGIPAIVAGLGAGLDRSTYSNMREAREMAYESNIIPTQRLFAGTIRRQLLRHFADETRYKVDFDNSQVRELQDDEDKLYERLDRGFRGGWLSLGDVRKAAAWPVEPGMDGVYLTPPNASYTTPDEMLPPAPPVLPPRALPPLPNPAVAPVPPPGGKALGPTVPSLDPVASGLAIGSPEELERLYRERVRAAGNGRH